MIGIDNIRKTAPRALLSVDSVVPTAPLFGLSSRD